MENDIMTLMTSRHSVRRYSEQPLDKATIRSLNGLIQEINKSSDMHIQLVVNDTSAFDCRMARYGKFSGVSNYIAIVGKEGHHLKIKSGYYGEQLVLKAQDLGLNTCWVGLTYKKNPHVISIPKGYKLVCVIAVGYGKTPGRAHKIKVRYHVMKVKGTPPDWFIRGIDAALLAPSAFNQQKFRFKLIGQQTVKAKSGWGPYTKIDLGIAMCHFEMAAGNNYFNWKKKYW